MNHRLNKELHRSSRQLSGVVRKYYYNVKHVTAPCVIGLFNSVHYQQSGRGEADFIKDRV